MTLLLQSRKTQIAQAISVLCVFLVFFVASAQAIHAHPDSIRHDCSICSIAHAGAIATGAFEPAPAFQSTALEACPEARAQSFQPAATHFIRPPPSV
jgi:hypothetical protein